MTRTITRILSTLAILALTGAATAQTPSPIIHYTFDDAAGKTTADSGASPLAPATLSGTAAWTTETPSGTGAALRLKADGTSQNYTGADSSKLAGLSQFTVTLWFNLRDMPAAHDRLVSTLTQLSPNEYAGFDISIQTPSKADLSARNLRFGLLVNGVQGDAAQFSANNSLNADNTWVFVAISYDGTRTSQNVNFYVADTRSDVIRLNSGNIKAGPVFTIPGPLRIGSTAASTTPRTPTADIDDVRIYDGVLSHVDLKAIRAASFPAR